MTNPDADRQILDKQNDEQIDLDELQGVILSQEEQSMFEQLDQDLAFQINVQELATNAHNLKPAEIKTKLLLLIYQFSGKRIEDRKALQDLMRKKYRQIDEDIRIMSLFLLNHSSRTTPEINLDDRKNLDNVKSKKQIVVKAKNKNLRDIIKRFAVYELYKFITPRRIAGESRQENFMHNMLIGGLKRALDYADNKAQVLERQNSNIHVNSKSNGMSL